MARVLLLLLLAVSVFIATGGSWWYTQRQYPIAPMRTISDCSWSTEGVDNFNNHRLYPSLSQLCERVFFTYWKVNYWRDCEIWEDENTECTWEPGTAGGGCQLCPCEPEEIPITWRIEDNGAETDQLADELITSLPHKEGCELSYETNESFWDEPETRAEDLWTVYDHSEEYINLQLNPERNTGYGGPHAGKIWRAIYMENCFSGKLEDQCLEERAFYRLVSGIHGSTATQVAERYEIVSQPEKLGGEKLGADRWEFEPNLPFFVYAIGAWPERAENIYFTWSVLLRAFHKARSVIEALPIDTGNLEDDQLTRQLIQGVLDSGECPTAGFDESTLFTGGQYKEVLKAEFKKKFHNVSRIMDCVACQNCRIHGKLSMLGIGTAMKILLGEAEQQPLQRNEMIALVNTMYKFSESIRVFELMRQRVQDIFMFRAIASSAAAVVVVLVGSFVLSKKKSTQPLTKKTQ